VGLKHPTKRERHAFDLSMSPRPEAITTTDLAQVQNKRKKEIQKSKTKKLKNKNLGSQPWDLHLIYKDRRGVDY